MDGTMRIAEVADRSGFSAATLRYYERLDLLPAPGRTAAGYRAYDESVLTRLDFIARAKMLGCSLEEVAELMPEWDRGRCAPVQQRLGDLIAVKLRDARARIAELSAFTADLEAILAELGSHTPDGPCDSDCGCLSGPPEAIEKVPASASADPAIACTLEAARLPGRLQMWRDLVTHVVDRVPIDGGTRLQLDSTTPLDELAVLAGAEKECCSFFAFAITVDSRGVGLEVRSPPTGQRMLDALFASGATLQPGTGQAGGAKSSRAMLSGSRNDSPEP